MNRIYPFQTQEVRDLAWACFSPPLLHVEQLQGNDSAIRACNMQLTPARQRWLESLDRDASALQEHLGSRPTHRLGVYFEQLWHFFLQQDAAVELIAHNLPVHDKGRTLGEFDCIYYCHQRQRHVHLELAVKFFLGAPNTGAPAMTGTGELREWLGPDTRDRLDLKLGHLLDHQILLGNREPAKTQLRALGITSLEKEIALKGYLFQSTTNAPASPPGFNANCVVNDWVPCSDLLHYLDALEAQHYLVMPKMRWLSAVRCDISQVTLTRQALGELIGDYFQREFYPLLVAALDASGAESRRFFVTPQNWPDMASESPPATGRQGT